MNAARVHLTGKEYQMLELLSLRKGTTLTKEMFLNHLYGGMDEPELKIIDVFICKLRKKLANASQGQELHRDRLGPRLCAARADRGRRAHPRLTKLRRAGLALSSQLRKRSGPRQQMAGFSFGHCSGTLDAASKPRGNARNGFCVRRRGAHDDEKDTRRTSVVIAGLAALAWAALTSRVESQQGARRVHGCATQAPVHIPRTERCCSCRQASKPGCSSVRTSASRIKPETTLSDAREANRAQDSQLFHNVYINPEAYAHFAATKEFPDPTMLVMEVFVPRGIATRGVLKSGVFNGQRVGIEVAVKDSRRPPVQPRHRPGAAVRPGRTTSS